MFRVSSPWVSTESHITLKFSENDTCFDVTSEPITSDKSNNNWITEVQFTLWDKSFQRRVVGYLLSRSTWNITFDFSGRSKDCFGDYITYISMQLWLDGAPGVAFRMYNTPNLTRQNLSHQSKTNYFLKAFHPKGFKQFFHW